MIIVEDRGGAIALMIASLCFLGTWPALLAFLERRGRLPQHTYLDYSLTNLLSAIIIAFTLGQIGHSDASTPNFITQLRQDNWPSVCFAMVGGLVLSLGNLSTQYALAYVGLSVTEVVSASITVVVGTTLNYFLDDRINRAEILFPGVGCFLIAICIGFALHTSNGADNMRKLQEASLQDRQKEKSVTIESGLAQKSMTYDSSGETQYIEKTTATKSVKAGVGTAEFLLGNLVVRRVQTIVEEDVFVAGRNAVHVCRGRGCAHGLRWHQEKYF